MNDDGFDLIAIRGMAAWEFDPNQILFHYITHKYWSRSNLKNQLVLLIDYKNFITGI